MSNFWSRKDKMKCYSKKNLLSALTRCKGFSLPEVVAALVILALISSSVLVVMNRCVTSAADSALRMQAFEVARENMETLLSRDSAAEMVEYGTSDKYPEIQWQTTVETFYEPITDRRWIQGICSTEYTDSAGDVQTIELTHWLTDLTKQQILEIIKEEQEQQKRLTDLIVETIEEAAEYAGVDVETIEQWIDDGMLKTEDGSFVKTNLDLYEQSNGNPPPEEVEQQVKSDAELIEKLTEEQAQPSEQEPVDEQALQAWLDEIDPATGLTNRELQEMDFGEIWKLLMERYHKEP